MGFVLLLETYFPFSILVFWLFSVHNKIKDCREHKYVYEYKIMFKYIKKENWCVYVLMWRRWKLWIWKMWSTHTGQEFVSSTVEFCIFKNQLKHFKKSTEIIEIFYFYKYDDFLYLSILHKTIFLIFCLWLEVCSKNFNFTLGHFNFRKVKIKQWTMVASMDFIPIPQC